jgi:hypothetical protein
MSKFEYNPSSFIVYSNENNTRKRLDLILRIPKKRNFLFSLASQSDPPTSGVRYIIGTHSHTLFISQDAHIRWAAHIDSTPVQIDVCTIQ